jgi:YebC/PmpR family DNA-binding regulatory protein
MSGHSKWHSIKHKKGINDAKRGKMFTQLCRAVTVAAKAGGGDTNFNFSLRMAVEKAKAGNVPKDNIEKAIKRGTGELEGDAIEEKRYQGYGPAGVAIIVDALTDNSNRTFSELRHAFSKNGGSIDATVDWQFEQKGVIVIPDKGDQAENEDILLEGIDLGIEDMENVEGDLIATTDPKQLQKAQEFFASKQMEAESADLQMLAKETIDVSGEDIQKVEAFLEIIDENDDVDKVFHNGEW